MLISIFWFVPRIPILFEFGNGVSVSVELLDDVLELLDADPPDDAPDDAPVLPPLFDPEPLPDPELPPDLLPELDPPLELPPELDPPPELPDEELEDVVVDVESVSSTGGGGTNVIARISTSIL